MPLPEFKQLVDEAKAQIKEIGPNELKHMQQVGDDFLFIDVRERDEQAKGAIAGAVSMPRGILEVNIDQITTDKDSQAGAVLRRRQSLCPGRAQPQEDGFQ